MKTTVVRCALILLLCFFSTPPVRAEWAGPGTTHVPICGDGAFQVGDGLWVGSPQAVEEPLQAADLTLLRGKPGFTGLTDAQIGAKWLKIRREVWDAIQLIQQFDYKLGGSLESAFLERRLFIEFSDRQVAGVVDSKSLGREAKDNGNGRIAIKAYPCDSVPDFDTTFVRMISVLSHEGLHLSQGWPPGFLDLSNMNWRLWYDELDKRILFQCNELEASRLERRIFRGMWEAMRGIRTRGEIPADGGPFNIDIPPVVREIAGRFLREVPAAEQQARAGGLERACVPLMGAVDDVIACRTLVKAKLEELRARPAPTDRFTMLPMQQEWITFIRGTGWFQRIGEEALQGVFSLTVLAGGAAPNANKVRQFDAAGTEFPITIPGLTAITDVAFVNDRSILIGGPSATATLGAVYSLTDTNLDNLFDAPSLTLVQSHSGLAGGVSLACDRVSGRTHCLGRQTGNLYALTPAAPALPTTFTFRASINSGPVLDENFFILAPPGENNIFLVPEFGGCITEAVMWCSVPAVGAVTNNIRKHRPIEDSLVGPVFAEHPLIGQKYIRCGGRPDTEIKLYNVAVQPPLLLDTTFTDHSGNGMFDYRGTSAGMILQLQDDLSVETSRAVPAVPVTDPNTLRLPQVFVLPGTTVPFIHPPVFFAPPHTTVEIDFTREATWSSSNTLVSTVSNAGGTVGQITATEVPPRAFWRCRWDGREDIVPDGRCHTVVPGVPTDINLCDGVFDFDTPNGECNSTYTILDRGGLNADQCYIEPGTSVCKFTALLTNDPSSTPDIIKVRRTDVVSGEIQDFILEFWSNRPALIEPEEALPGLLSVQCLFIGGKYYPIYQFTLSNSETDLCVDPHWHSGGSAWSVDGTSATEPADSCGWGLLEAIPVEDVLVGTTVWLNFVAAHPPNVRLFN